ncbi:hypothetical protein LBMAG21_11870 [Armatimonadota bacterium]|nr:hypothetical protein LBMAG21_11870 [Armatimonadota bacterium]
MLRQHTRGLRVSLLIGQILVGIALLSLAQGKGQGQPPAITRHSAKNTMTTSTHYKPIAARAASTKAHRFETLGLYVTPPTKEEARYYDFYKTCGYNYLEFCDIGFSWKPSLLPKYYAETDEAIKTAKKRGFKVWILLLAGMKQWKGETDRGDGGTFSALKKEALQERLSYIRQAVQGLPHADGFAFFAGDPGGDPEGRSTVQDCIHFAREVRNIVRENAPKAKFVVNMWAIAEWDGFPSPFSLDFWQKQVRLSTAVAQDKSLLGEDCGVVFSMDNYYRSLTLTCYDDAGVKPELYPKVSDVQKLRQQGVHPIYGWPYFLVDEVDDGFITPNNVVTKGQSQAETRYIRAILDSGREIGLDGMIANSAFISAEPLNIYAFGRMGGAPQITPEALLDEYAGFLANAETKHSLGQVLRFIENYSNWENSLPKPYRLKPLDCGDITSPAIALERLALVVPRQKPPIVLPEAPALYLKRLERRLQAIAKGDIGGIHPIIKSSSTPKGEKP